MGKRVFDAGLCGRCADGRGVSPGPGVCEHGESPVHQRASVTLCEAFYLSRGGLSKPEQSDKLEGVGVEK